MLGVNSSPRTGSLQIRKQEGGLVVEGTPPDVHTFPRKFIERELKDAVRVQIVITAAEPLIYEVTGFDGTDFVAHRLHRPKVVVSPTKPRWWHRFRRNRV